MCAPNVHWNSQVTQTCVDTSEVALSEYLTTLTMSGSTTGEMSVHEQRKENCDKTHGKTSPCMMHISLFYSFFLLCSHQNHIWDFFLFKYNQLLY